MASTRRRLDSASPPRFSAEALQVLDSMTADEIERGAEADPDNPPMTEAELRRVASSRMVRRVRRTTGLSQTEFACRFHIGLGRLRDWEQGRSELDSVATAYLKVVEVASKAVERALQTSTKG